MSPQRIAIAAVAVALILTACSREPSPDPVAPAATTPGTQPQAADPAASDAADPVAAAGAPQPGFDEAALPLSQAELGAFPYFGLADGYVVREGSERGFARFPFWTPQGAHWVEGRIHAAAFVAEGDKSFSALEVRRNLETLVERAGGVEVFNGRIPGEAVEAWGDEITQGFIDGLGDVYNEPATVYAIRQPDRSIWIHLLLDSNSGEWVIAESRAFEPDPQARWQEAFPHLALPQGYQPRGRPETRDFDRFPFWTGTAFEWVEGRTFVSAIERGEDGGEYSQHELRRQLVHAIEQAGGTRVFEGRIPGEALDGLDRSVRQNYLDGLGDPWNDPIAVYRIDRDGGQVWVHLGLDYMGGGWVIAQAEGFTQSAQLLPAAELKRQLEAEGRVALQVHFATDQAEVLPESEPQIAQILQLLQDDPALRLEINGHTDDTGEATHNRRLSQSRAQAVVDRLTAEGIDPGRLQPQGFGQDRPLADNATEEGRARNRRVELVRI